MMQNPDLLWVIAALGAGGLGLRYVVSGLLGALVLPFGGLRGLGLVAVPGVAMPLALWPDSMRDMIEPSHIGIGIGLLILVFLFRRAILSLLTGGITLLMLLYLFI